MTNFEFYKDDIKAIGFNFGIARSSKFLNCSSLPCVDCAFHCNECSEYKFKWLCEEHEEHVEQPKLTKNERELCKLLSPDTYIAKDKSGSIYAYSKKPNKRGESDGWWYAYEHCASISEYIFVGCNFSFITWEDEKPWSVKDLLKLEVME